jgi:hypothetical protein
MENLLTLAKPVVTDGITFLMAEDSNILHISAIALILLFLAARIAIKKHCASDRILESQHTLARKQCPNCAEQLPLVALLCDACDYNFLSGMVGSGQKLLPSPVFNTRGVSKQSFTSARR